MVSRLNVLANLHDVTGALMTIMRRFFLFLTMGFWALIGLMYLLTSSAATPLMVGGTQPTTSVIAPDDFDCSSVAEIPTIECQTLVSFYNALNGNNWIDKSNWLMTTTPCNWFGITCSGNHVSDIKMQGNALNGTIPSDIGNLSQLRLFHLHNNQISGSFPASFTNMTELQSIRLNNNQLSGGISSNFGNLSQLQLIDLSNNSLSGSISGALGNLSSLQTLDLSNNDFIGSIPSNIGALSQLQRLSLNGNNLTGSIPGSLGNLTNLQRINLSHNQIGGIIPNELSSLTYLTGIDVSNNQLTGAIPNYLGNITGLSGIRLENNQLSGIIPSNLGNLSNIIDLDLSGNRIDGNIPASIGNISTLTRLYLVNNQIKGDIPDSITNLTSLSSGQTDIGYNMLYSTSPAVIAFLSSKDPDWNNTQTIAPANLPGAGQANGSVQLTWTPIPYATDGGYYELGVSPSSGGPYTTTGTTVNFSFR